MTNPCKKCSTINWSSWTSSTSNKVHKYCKTCRQHRALSYSHRKANATGTHTNKEWLIKLAQFENCPACLRLWNTIPPRPDIRYKKVWTKDHITPLNKGGSDSIKNIQPLCYQCNFGKR